ncbi:MAG: 4'-phosphopantetheinyl transferase superfamily protein [Candidatus Rickettsiella isopodorum]
MSIYWRTLTRPPILTLNTVDVWYASLRVSHRKVKQFSSHLTLKEKKQAARILEHKDRKYFTVARGVLRWVLGQYLNIPPKDVAFYYGEYGKPYLSKAGQDHPLQFNLSHAGDMVVCAVTQGQLVGIDIEYIQEQVDYETIAKRFFSSTEFEALLALPPNERQAGFFRLWTGKEAFVKAIGKGLSFPLRDFAVTLDQEKGRILHIRNSTQRANKWSLIPFTPAAGYIGALAVAKKSIRLRFRQFLK